MKVSLIPEERRTGGILFVLTCSDPHVAFLYPHKELPHDGIKVRWVLFKLGNCSLLFDQILSLNDAVLRHYIGDLLSALDNEGVLIDVLNRDLECRQ